MVNPEQPQSDFVSIELPVQILDKIYLNPVEEIKQIWKAFKKNPADQTLRNQLIERYTPLVRHHAGQLCKKLPDKVDANDLFSAGVFGLIDAIDGFDPEKGNKFEAYCALRIRVAMLDELRKMDWVPRLVRSQASKLAAAQQAVESERGRPPTDEELAEKLQMTLSGFNLFRGKATAIRLIELDKKRYETDNANDVSEGSLLKDAKGEDPTKTAKEIDLLRLVTRGMDRQERLLLILYYYQGLTFKQIGNTLGVGESRVSQMHKVIIARLKDRLSERRSEFV
ncbi:MAG: FliA/WhiG family RNA polymerase sigma factor [Planctomycetaceae bacterium]|nr:FliA/WhiG family RNA polymerase sigma factor [Planctomycetaceae bacterium]